MTKVMTIRIDDHLNEEVNAVARADDLPASEVVRAALHHYIAARKSDPLVQARLRELLARDTAVVERFTAAARRESKGHVSAALREDGR